MPMNVKIIRAVFIFIAMICSTVAGDYVNGSFVVTIYAGNGANNGNGVAATSAAINITDFANVWVNQSTIYFAEPFRNQVRYIDPSTLTVNLLAGTGTASSTGNGGQATSATLNYPRSVCAFKSSLFVVEGRSHCIRKVDMVTGIISTLAGICGTSGNTLTGTGVTFNGPIACVADTTGAVYVSEGFLGSSCRIRKITSSSSTAVFVGDGNCGAVDRLSRVGKVPSLSIDSAGALFFSGDRNVRRVDSSASTIFAGSTTIGFKDGLLTSAQCNNVGGVWVDSTGAIFFSDYTMSGTEVIRYISSQRTTVGTISFGRYASNEFTNGVALWDAYFDAVGGIMGDSTGALYITVKNSAVIRKASFPSPTTSPTQFPTATPTLFPTVSAIPSIAPTAAPSFTPSVSPSYSPTATPSFVPTVMPSVAPSAVPTATPSGSPTYVPSNAPTAAPTVIPSYAPSCTPSYVPTAVPTATPSVLPTETPTVAPTGSPSYSPTYIPTYVPTVVPTAAPSASPTVVPTAAPTGSPSCSPSEQPTMVPTACPSVVPTTLPSKIHTATPTQAPTHTPTFVPSMDPTASPSDMPTASPTHAPTVSPSAPPSIQPSPAPTTDPTCSPTWQPSCAPTASPTWNPSVSPTIAPSFSPTQTPTWPTFHPTSVCPTSHPSSSPSSLLSKKPTKHPTIRPTSQPSLQPSSQPTLRPSTSPSCQPSSQPSSQPVGYPTRQPTNRPSSQPTNHPSRQPSNRPTTQPSRQPSSHPSIQPSTQPSRQPSTQPTLRPSSQPSCQPSCQPSVQPTMHPSQQPSIQPTNQPTGQPSRPPSTQPTSQPSGQPSSQPSMQPTFKPTSFPTTQPSRKPSVQPSYQPTSPPSSCPSILPSSQPTERPSRQPTAQPSCKPFPHPTSSPSQQPSCQPSKQPSALPTGHPSLSPSSRPSISPSPRPIGRPSTSPSSCPTSEPSFVPSAAPSLMPSTRPTRQPSPTPSALPSSNPSFLPLSFPSGSPTTVPSRSPSSKPSSQPVSDPTSSPSLFPTRLPSGQPTSPPSTLPTVQPTGQPTICPSNFPSVYPTSHPNSQPTRQPTNVPSTQPSAHPSRQPSVQPSSQPSRQPTSRPTVVPSISLLHGSAKSLLSAEFSLSAAVININIKLGQDLMVCPSPLSTQLTTTVAGLPTGAWRSLWTSRWSLVIQLFYESMRPQHFANPITVALQGCDVKLNTSIQIAPLTFSATASSSLCSTNRTCVIPLAIPSAVASLGWPLQNVSIHTPARTTPISAKMSNIYVIAVDEQVPRVNASACTITGRCVETTVALPDSPRDIGVSLVLGHTGPVHWRSKPLHIFSQLLVPDWSAVRRWNFTYNWTVVDTSSGVAVHGIGRSNDPSLLTFPSFSLLADCTYQAVVSLVEVGITSPPVLFSVTADPIAVVLQPSQRTHYVAVGDTIRFDASKSYDANNDIGARSSSALSFAWQCVDDPASFCQLRSTALAPLNSIVDVSVAERAVAGAMFRLRVVVRHRTSNRQADATVLIVVQPKGTPRVDLVTNASVLSWRNVPMSTAVVWAVQARVNRSSCLDPTACGLSWSVASTSGGGTFSADMKSLARVAAVQASSTWLSQIITFHPSSFATGVLYTFRVTLGTQLTLAELDIAMNRPPFGGILDVTPRSGVAMQTTFHLAAYGWKDDASSDYPLTYDYRYFVLNQWWQLINPSALPFVEATRLPWNTSVSVRVTVADVWSAASTAVRSVSLTKIADDRWQLSSYWQLINATYPTTTAWLRQGGLVLVDVRRQYTTGLFRAVTLIPLVTVLQSRVNETVEQRTDPSMRTMGQALVSNINLFRLELHLQAARDQVYNDLFASSSSTNASAQGSLDQATKAFDSLTPLLLGMLTAGTSTAGPTTVNTVTISTGGMTASFSVISFGSPSSSSSSDNSSAPSSVSLSIPNSANSISLSTTGGAATAGVIVSLVQLDASSLKSSSFLPANATANGTTGGNAAAAALTQAKLSSDVITIQLISASTNGSKSSLTLPTFDASLTLTSSTTNTPDTGPTSLQHNCSVGVRETVSLFCKASKVRVNITCTGDVAASVKRSCPVSKHVCSVLNLADNTVASNDYCQAIVTGSSVLCRCGYNAQSGNTSSNAALLALNGRISVAAFSSFATGELDSSVSLAGASLNANLAGRSIVIFVTFSCFWGISLVFMGLQHMRAHGLWWPVHPTKQPPLSSIITPTTTTTATAALAHEHPSSTNQPKHTRRWRHAATKAQARELDKQSDGFYSYLVAMLPPALVSSEPWWHRLRTTLLTRHLYFRAVQVLMVPYRPTESAMDVVSHGQRAQAAFDLEQRRRKLDVIHVLTALTMSCFVLALLYDLQYPADDGYCGAQPDQATCLYRKSLLDPWRSRCLWIAQLNVHPVAAVVTESLHGQLIDQLEVNAQEDATAVVVMPCQLNDVNSSQVAFISSFFITSIFATLLDFFLDFSFEILNADFSKNATARRDALAAEARRHAQAQPMTGAVDAGGATVSVDFQALDSSRVAEETAEPTRRSPPWWRLSASLPWPRWRMATTGRGAVSPYPPAACAADVGVQPPQGHTHHDNDADADNDADNDDEKLKLMVMVVPDAVMNARRRWVTSASTVERAGGPRGRHVVVARQQRRPGTIGDMIPQVVSSAPPPMDAPSTSVAMPSRGRRAAISVMPVVLAVGPSTTTNGSVPVVDHVATNAATSTTSSASHAPPPSGSMPNAHRGGGGVSGGGVGGGGVGGGSGHSSHLALASDAEFGVSLMHVVVADAIETLSGSREKRNIVLHTIRRSYAEMYFVHEAWQYVFMVVLLVMNGGAFYFIISKAAMRGMSWQFAFLRACSLEWFTEIFLIEVLECLLLDFALPAYVHHDVLQCVAMFVHLQAMRMGQKQQSQQLPRQQNAALTTAQPQQQLQQQEEQSSVVPEDAFARRGWSSLSNEALRASDSPLVALALLRPNVKESRFALVCHDYMASLRAVRHGSFHGSSGQQGAPSEQLTTMPRWTRWWWMLHRTLRRGLRRGLRRVFDWYCRRSAGTQETILNVSTSVLVAVSIFLWFAVVQPALVGGNLIAASVTWLVVLGGGLYVAVRVLFAIRRAPPTLITPWTDPVDTASTDAAAVLREAEAAKRSKEQEALPHEVKLDDEDDSGDRGRSLDGDVDVRGSRSDARSALDAVVRRSCDASSWSSLDAASWWSNFSRSDGSADGIADGDGDGDVDVDDDEADKGDRSEDGRDSLASNDSQQWAALFASTSPSSGSAASRHRHQPSSPPASLDRQWSLSQSDDEGGEDPNAALLFDDWDAAAADDDDVDDVDAPLHRTPTGKASASSVVSSRFSFD